MKKLLSVLLVTALVLAALPLTALPALAAISGGFEYYVLSEEDKTCQIAGYNGTATELTIPSQLGGYTVELICDYAFQDNTSLKSVVIPGTIQHIGFGSFAFCTALENVQFEDGVLSLDEFTFEGCTSIKSVFIPDSMYSVGYGSFAYCTSLTDISVSDTHPNYTAENGTLFSKDKTKLIIYPAGKQETSYTIPDGVTDIFWYAFAGCSSLVNVSIPNGVETICDGAFCGCSALTNVTIPGSVKNLGDSSYGDGVFQDCEALESVTILSTKISIANEAFNGSKLKTIYGYIGSDSETFANRKGYTFFPLNIALKNEVYDISVLFPAEVEPAETTALNVEKLSAEETAITYDITLTVNEEIVQPSSAVTVKIPVPETMDGVQCKVYRQEADGTYTDMQATYQNGYMVFTTDHFSTYILTTKRLGICLGDLNGDDKINAVDARWVLQAASGARTFDATQTAAADVNGDGKVNAVDARWILQVASGARTL